MRGESLRCRIIGDTHIGDAHIGDAHIGDAHIGDTHIGDARIVGAGLGKSQLLKYARIV